jgi:hypothetical protein
VTIRDILKMQWTKNNRVEWLRNRALEVRRTAYGMRLPESRALLLQVAENYEKFARQRESRMARRPSNGPVSQHEPSATDSEVTQH